MPVDTLQWALLATSLCNAILLIWLGGTVLLNAARRGWGVWVAALALGSGALFFLFHAAIISLGLDRVSPGIIARWPLVWLAGFAQPYAWYLVMCWYGGYWAPGHTARHRGWHRAFHVILCTLVATTVLYTVYYPFSPLRAYTPALLLAGPTLGGVSVVSLVYLALIIGSTALALDILLFPAPSSRLMGDLARRRARPWLLATSVVLLTVNLLLGWTLLRVAPNLLDRPPGSLPPDVRFTLVWADLLISLGVTGALLLLGQAIAAYELFSGTTLPRGGMRRQWRNAVILAVTFGALMALALAWEVPAIFSMLLIAGLLGVFYVLHNWRSYAERESFMARLRPFIAGPRVTEALQPGEPLEADAAEPFHALCTEVLGARWACLAAAGPFAALVTPLVYPATAETPGLPASLLARCADPRTLTLPVAPGTCGAATWAVPLWGPRGLVGLLLLGEKADGGLYTQEEMEVARAAGERLIDALAGAQMARRLVQVQRARLSEDQLADRRTRHVIHDDILPRLHALLMTLSADPAQAETVAQLTDTHHALAALLRDLPATALLDIAHHGVIGALRADLERAHATDFSTVAWHVDPAAEARARALSPLAAEVLYGAAREAIRNAARYARGTDPARPVTLTVTLADTTPLALHIADDGLGPVPAPALGTGQGIRLHSAMLALLHGAWTTDHPPTGGTRVTLTLPEGE